MVPLATVALRDVTWVTAESLTSDMNGTPIEGLGKGLTKRVVFATSWTLAGTVAGQILRFASNLILTRLLFPQAFGMMAIASAILAGLEMLSDLGVGPSIVRNPQPTRAFLDTLWSMQVARGWLQWAVSLMIAYPIALWYGERALVYLIPAIGLVEHYSRLRSHFSVYPKPRA